MKHRLSYRLFAATAMVACILSACGGGGGGGGGGGNGPATSSEIKGAVIDGYLKGAVVCLDMNANLKCDGASEFQTKSGDSGAYTLALTSGMDVSKYHVLAEVGTDAIDSDTNSAPANPYSLLAPAADAGVVTPLTTFVSHTLISNAGLTLDEAKTQVLTSLNLPAATKLNQDYVATRDDSTHRVAVVAAAVLGQVKSDLSTATASATEAQKVEIIKAAVKQAQTSLGSYTQAAASPNGDLKSLKTAATAEATKQVNAQINNIKQQAELGTSTPTSFAELVKSGLFDIWAENTMIYGANDNVGTFVMGAKYLRTSLVDGSKVIFERYYSPLINRAWIADFGNSSSSAPSSVGSSGTAATTSAYYAASETSSKWVDNTEMGNVTWVPSTTGSTGTLNFEKTGFSQKITMTALDVGGKQASKVPYVLPNPYAYCGWSNGYTQPIVCADWQDFTFSSGAQIIDGTGYRNQNQYSVTDCTGCGVSSSAVKTLDDLIASANGADGSTSNMLWGVSKIPAVLTKVNDTSGTVSFQGWDNTTKKFKEVGKGRYEITTVAGKKVLTLQVTSENTPGTLVSPYEGADAEYSVNVVDDRVIFVEWGGKVLGGRVYLKGKTATSRMRPSFNRIAADDLLRAQGYLPTK